MELLKYQAMLHQETGPNGRMRSQKWHMSSITSHDFLLAATIVCLDLYYSRGYAMSGHRQNDIYAWGLDRQEEMLGALEQSKNIWSELRDHSMDAFKASEVLGVMLENIKASRVASNVNTGNMFPEPQDEKQSAAITLGMLSSGGVPPQQTSPSNGMGNTNFDSRATFDNLLGLNPGQGQQPDGAANAPSPFSMFGPQSTFQDVQNMGLDWVSQTYLHSLQPFISSLLL